MAANTYGRLMQIMAGAGEEDGSSGMAIGEMMSGSRVKVNDLILDRADYMILTNELKVGSKTMKIPYKKQQSSTVHAGDGTSVTVTVPPLKKGDKVLCYQVDDEDVIILGRLE